ncbi:leishmanolysin-like peptidase [Schistosoma bovis]|uniref:Leishmanolysin-like peptidase n=1 Tax=Schistosoma bovis TaxID=6184 RepID=A0A430QJ82_SCHBO|nr:leishmanolysin-like peptidase [Schistosoma bovis]
MWKIKDIILFPIFGVHFIISGLRYDRFSTLCHHGVINHSEVVTHVVSSDVQKLIRRNSQTELRIHTHYDRSIKSLKNFQDIKRDVIEVAIEFWEDALLLRQSHTVPRRLTLDSPMAGYINFCPDTLSNEYNDKMRSLFVATHEILHSLRIARSFYNCPNLDGVELEDEDDAGVYLTHWEKRLLENDLMTATYTNSFRISPITLAMMEDTGWYIPNYALSQSFSWGRGRGCTFATGSCLEYMLEQSRGFRKLHNTLIRGLNRSGHPIAPFCQQLTSSFHNKNNGLQVSCTPGEESYGFCNLIEYSKPLPDEYVYFVNTNFSTVTLNSEINLGTGNLTNQYPLVKLGGKIALANYCPYHQFRCSMTEGGLILELAGGMSIPCEVPGELSEINACLTKQSLTVKGKLVCPDCRLLCPLSECPKIYSISQNNVTYLRSNYSNDRSSSFLYETNMFIPKSRTIQYSQLIVNETESIVENPLYIVENSKNSKGIVIQQAILPGACLVNIAYSSTSLTFSIFIYFVVFVQLFCL